MCSLRGHAFLGLGNVDDARACIGGKKVRANHDALKCSDVNASGEHELTVREEVECCPANVSVSRRVACSLFT